MDATPEVRQLLAPRGTLRAGVNLANFLLVTGRTEAGAPVGVSPDMAQAVAERLDVPCELVTFASPGQVADAAAQDRWDIALIAHEAERAISIVFSPAYVEIEATCLVPAGSTARSLADIDKPGMRVAVSARSAYDLYLARTLRQAQLVSAEGLAAARDLFVSRRLDALAGLRPGLLDDARAIAGSRVLDGRFTTVRQAIGIRPGNPQAAAFLADLVRGLRADGTIQGLIDRHGVTGRLQVGTD